MLPDPEPLDERKGTYKSAFERGPEERPLRLVADWPTLGSGVDAELLRDLRAHDLIEVMGASEQDAPAIALEPGNANGHDVMLVRSPGQEWPRRVMIGEAADYERLATRLQGTAREELTRIMWEARLAAFCRHYGVDVLVTNSSTLLQPPAWEFRTCALPLRQALALAGLFLRSRDDHRVRTGRPGWQVWEAPEVCYERFSRVLLPSSTRWLGAAFASQLVGHPQAALLATSSLGRVSRTLRARDYLQTVLRGVHTSDTADQAAYHFEAALVALGGAFDGLAQLAGRVYRIGSDREAGWRAPKWLKKLAIEDPALAALAGRPNVKAVQNLLADLRNTVHGHSLEPRVDRHPWKRKVVTSLEFPSTRLDELEATLRSWPQLDPESHWGIRLVRLGRPVPGQPGARHVATVTDPLESIVIQPARCLERLLAACIPILDDLGGAIDWYRLAAGGLPLHPSQEIGDDNAQERIRLLGGVGT